MGQDEAGKQCPDGMPWQSPAWESLRSHLIAVARRGSLSREDAEDALQEALFAILRMQRRGMAVLRPGALLRSAVRRAALAIARAAGRRRRAVVGSASGQAPPTGEVRTELSGNEEFVMLVVQGLPKAAAQSLADHAASASDDLLAVRDEVASCAIRQRRSRLVRLVVRLLDEKDFLDLLSQKGASGIYMTEEPDVVTELNRQPPNLLGGTHEL
ncbi:MAG: hypothetical protein MUC36_02605 [Planctomycetes bacterium]|jgi:DNA-directed RNA polymerase specialized sigma24 family protein|nr:hypothetical protein [Planctomycetota bacterium]